MIIDGKTSFDRHIFICTNQKEDKTRPCCNNGGGYEIYKSVKEYVKSKSIKNVKVTQAKCFSMCAEGPNMVVYPEQIWHHGVSTNDVSEIIEKYIKPLEK